MVDAPKFTVQEAIGPAAKASPLSKLTGGSVDANGAKKLKFPVNLDETGHYAQFTAYERGEKSILKGARGEFSPTAPVQTALANIFLPMPASLNTGYNADYQNEDIGLLGNFMAQNADKAIETMEKGISAVGKGIMKAAKGDIGIMDTIDSVTSGISGGYNYVTQEGGLVDDLKKQFTGDSAAKKLGAVAAVAAMRGGGTAKTVLAQVAGRAVNPHRVILFQGVQFREFQFSYRLSPKNEPESRTITSMIKAFKYYMLPQFGGGGGHTQPTQFAGRAYLDYPQLFKIKFKNDAHLFKVLPCVLKSFSVQYHPMGYPAYIRTEQTVAPVEVEIQMTFQEIQMFTKESVQDEGADIKALNDLAFDEADYR